MAGSDAEHKRQLEKNELKFKLQSYTEVYEYKKVRIGPFSYMKKVPKSTLASELKDERAALIGELDPDADPIPDEIASLDREFADADRAAGRDTSIYEAKGPVQAKSSKPGLMSRFATMFTPVETSDHSASDDDAKDAEKTKKRRGLFQMSEKEETEKEAAAAKKAKKRKERRRKALRDTDDDFAGDVTPRPPTPETNPVYREKAQGPTKRPKEGFPWDLREAWHPYRIFISATQEDHISELKLIYDEVLRDCQEEAAMKRIKVILVYVQDGLSAAEVHKCGVAMRFKEIERSNCMIFLQGRIYGDVPPAEELQDAVHEYEWLGNYPPGRSYQELEAAMAIPGLRTVADKDKVVKLSKEERKKRDDAMRDMWESAMSAPMQKVLVAQRNAGWSEKAPEHLQLVFKDAVYERQVLQRQLRMRSLKALMGIVSSANLPDYRCEFESNKADGTYILGDLDELQDFLVREIKPHFHALFPDDGHGRWLRSTIDIDECSQSVWSIRSRALRMAIGREEEVHRMTAYCDSEDSMTPMLVLGGEGTGKTSLMLKFLAHYADTHTWGAPPNEEPITKGWRHRGRMLVLSHFTSASHAAKSPTRMLERFCQRMSEHFFLDDPYLPAKDYPALCLRFISYLDRVATSYRGDSLLMIVDSLEELALWNRHSRCFVEQHVSPVEWVPERFRVKPFFPVRLVLALDPSHFPQDIARMRTRLHSHQTNEVELTPLSEEARVRVVAEMVASRRKKKLADFPGLFEACSPIQTMTASAQPLFLYFAALQLAALDPRLLVQHARGEIAGMPTNLSDLAVTVVHRIELECDARSGYMKEVIQLLCCCRRGLMEQELWELIKLRCTIDRSRPKLYRLLMVLQHMDPLIQSRPGWSDHGGETAIQLSHSFLRRILVSRYLKNAQTEDATHRRLADMFYQALLQLNLERLGEGTAAWLYNRIITDAQSRALSEVMHHATKAKMVEETVELSCSLRMLELRLMFDHLAEMLEDYREAVEMLTYAKSPFAHQVGEFYTFLQVNSIDLLARPSCTFQLAANSPMQTGPAIASRAMLQTMTEKRVWLEYRNKKQDNALGSSFDLGAKVLDLWYSSDSRFLTAVSDKRTTHVFDTFAGIEVHKVTDFNHVTTCACLTPAGDILVTAAESGMVSFWDVASGERDGTFPLHSTEAMAERRNTRVNRLKCAHDGRCLILACEDHTVVLLDANPNNPFVQARLKGHTGSVLDCDVSRDNKYVVSASEDRTLRVWDTETHACIQQCVGHYDAVLACSFGGAGHAIFSSSSRDSSVRTWQTATGVVIAVYSGHKGQVYGCAMGVIGPQVISSGEDATIRVWDMSDGSQLDQWGRLNRMQLQYAEGHVGSGRRCLLSHDCLRAVSSGDDGTVKIWKLKGGHEKQINFLSFTPDRTRVITCSNDKTVRSFEVLSSTEMTKSVGHVGPVRRVAVAPGESSWQLHGLPRRANNQTSDTCVVATASDDGQAHMININTGMNLQHLKGHERGVNHVEFSPQGDLIATASADATVKVWDAVTGALKCTLTGHTSEISAIMFTKDQKALLSVSHDTSARVWDIEGGFLLALLSGHTKAVTCVDYSPKSNRAVTGSKDKTLRLWNMWKAAQTKTLRGHTAGILACAFSKNGTRIFSGSRDKTIRVWGVDDTVHKGWTPQAGYAPMQQLTSLKRKAAYPGAKATVIAASPSDMHVAVGYDDGVIELIRQTNYVVDQSWSAHTADVTGLDFSKDGSLLCSCGWDRAVHVYRIEYVSNSPRSQQLNMDLAGSATSITLLHKLELWPVKEQWLHECTFNHKDTQVIVCCEDAVVYVVDLEKEKFAMELKGHRFRATCVAVHPDGVWMASGSYDKTICVWHGETGMLRNRIAAFDGAVLCLGFLPFGPFLCAGSVDKQTKVFHVLTCEQLFSLSAHALSVRRMSISADGVIATASDDKEIRLWDCRMPWGDDMGTCLRICTGHKGAITCCEMTRQGTGMLSAAEDCNLFLWDVVHGAVMRVFVGHTGPISKVFLLNDPDEPEDDDDTPQRSRITGNVKNIVSASKDGTIRVWDIATGYDVCFSRPGQPILCMAKTQDNAFFAAGDSTGGLHIFRLRGI